MPAMPEGAAPLSRAVFGAVPISVPESSGISTSSRFRFSVEVAPAEGRVASGCGVYDRGREFVFVDDSISDPRFYVAERSLSAEANVVVALRWARLDDEY